MNLQSKGSRFALKASCARKFRTVASEQWAPTPDPRILLPAASRSSRSLRIAHLFHSIM